MEQAQRLVMVVATEPDASVLTKGLMQAGFTSRVVRDIQHAADAAQLDYYVAIMIADDTLPRSPTLSFSMLRSRTTAPIVVTGWAEPDERAELLLDGADSYLVRPIPTDILRARLRALDARRAPRRRPNNDLYARGNESRN